MQYSGEYTENVHSFVNNISTTEGGTHLSGFRAALTRTINAYGKKNNLFKDLKDEPSGDDCREGLTAVICVRVPEPQFEGQTKTKLGNSEIEGIVNSAVGDYLGKFLEENPKTAQDHRPRRACWRPRPAKRPARPGNWSAAQGRPRAAAACPASSATAPAATSTSASCTWSRAIRPAAAPSRGATAKFQAILPLRGKIINAYKSREDKVLANEEVRSMISAIGAGIGDEMDLAKRRYSKIIIMTDADVDGSHIRTLLLTFFYRQMYDLVERRLRLRGPAAAVPRQARQGRALHQGRARARELADSPRRREPVGAPAGRDGAVRRRARADPAPADCLQEVPAGHRAPRVPVRRREGADGPSTRKTRCSSATPTSSIGWRANWAPRAAS